MVVGKVQFKNTGSRYTRMRRASSPFTYMAIIFVFCLGIMLALFTSSGTQFQNIPQATTITSGQLNNAQIGQDQVQGSLQTTTTTTGTTGNTLVCIFAPLPLCQAVWAVECTFGIADACANSATNIVNPNPANSLNLNALSGNQAVRNNGILSVLANPLSQALLALATFMTLGILAGLFGAGLMARVMVLAGLALSVVLYIEGQMTAFSGMPTFLWWMFNGIMTVILIIIIHEAFTQGGVG